VAFVLNGDSFNGLEQYEQMPFTKFMDLLHVYNKLQSKRQAAIEQARK
jgi:hypothetical protein